MQILRLDHLVLRVRDVAASIHFYQQLLGCEVEREVESLGLVQLRAGDSLIDLLPVEAAASATSAEPNLDHFCLLLEPFDRNALAARCEALELEWEAPKRRYGATGFGPSVYVRDPDGNRLELKGRGGL